MKTRILTIVLAFIIILTVGFSTAWATMNANRFTDVKSGDWFADDVKYVVEREWFRGVTGTSFEPDAYMT